MMALMLLAAAGAGCVRVEGDRILAREMARAWPAFSQVAPDILLGYAPVPGARRIFSLAELARLAARHGVAPPPEAPVCFERPMTALRRERVLEAMRATLELPEARIDIVELSRYPVPEGELVFARSGLRAPGRGAPPGTPVLWRGSVLYGGGRRFAVWARVVVTAPLRRVRAAQALPAGRVIEAGQLRVVEEEGFPISGREAVAIEDVAGLRPRRTIPSGAAIPLALLERPPQVERGDRVRVKVLGPVRLEFMARAESDGAQGQIVTVRNPKSRRTFQARVAGRGEVEVKAGGTS
jgi:flagella basal body P-ring formation protein FlgA